MQFCKSVLLLVTAAALLVTIASAQGGNGTVQVNVTDPSGAVVKNATINLTDVGTGTTVSGATNASGQFIFTNVRPGTYTAKVTAAGFQTATLPTVVVEVNRSITLPIKLAVGTVAQTVEVTAITQQLQTLDASVGNVLTHSMMQNLPSLQRDVTAVLMLQPMAAPGFNATPALGTGNSPASGEGNETGGGIAGARSDQNTFTLDGSDVTSDMEATGGYTTGFGATPRAVVPTPVESIQEFRVTTNNDPTFSRSVGGEVQLVTPHGTNAWHGSAYENNQNTDYNANSWQLNHAGKPRGIWLDNRFGGSVGGPVLKDKLFFYANYEGQRLKKGVQFTRLVPSELFKSGILQYRNTSGGVSQIPIRTADPRGIGISPVISSIWNQFEPPGNNTEEGDHLNTIGFDANVPAIQNGDFGVARVDYKINNNWNVFSSYRYDTTRNLNSAQVDIGGILPGHVKGTPAPTREIPLQPRFAVFGLTGRLGSNFTNDLRFGYLRNFWQWKSVSPFPQVSGTTAAVQIFAETSRSNLVPLNLDTQSARSRVWNGNDYTWNDNATWLHGNHLFTLTGEARWLKMLHLRDDKVVAALTKPIFFADRTATRTSFSSSLFPADIDPGFKSNFRNAEVAALGLISTASQVFSRNPDLSPTTPGTPIVNDSRAWSYDFNFLDTWRMTPSFTLSYGVGWGVQLPAREVKGRQAVMVDTSTGKIITANGYLRQLDALSQQGQFFGPTIGFAPVHTVGRDNLFETDWSNVSPRLAFAWSPGSDKQTVVRAGYGRYYERFNGVAQVLNPAISPGFGDGVFCKSPLANNPAVLGSGATCQTGQGMNSPRNGFRIGVDGSTITLPTLTTPKAPEVPGSDPGANIPFQILNVISDFHRQNGYTDTFTMSVQRQLPSNLLVEVGYVGRLGRHLNSQLGLNQTPYNFKVKGQGQTFAQGWDALAKQVDAGANAATVTAVPFFEAFLAGGCAGFSSCTSMVLDPKGLGLSGLIPERNVTDFFDALQFGFLGCNGGTSCPGGGLGFFPSDRQQEFTNILDSHGTSNYNAGYVSVRKQTSRGLAFQVNYTYSKSTDSLGYTQESSGVSANDSFRPLRDYGPSFFDRPHVVNLFWSYDLPFGQGHRFAAGGVLNRIIGGWNWAGSFTASSGIPEVVYNFDSCEEFGEGPGEANCSPMISTNGKHFTSSAHYNADGSVSIFGNVAAQAAVFNNFREPLFADLRDGFANPPRGFGRWNLDLSLGKTTKITERVTTRFGLQAVNALNHVEFVDPGLDLSGGPSLFGDTGGIQFNSPRFLNIFFRVDF